MNNRKIIIAITGASGSIYAHRLIGKIAQNSDEFSEVALVFSPNAEKIWEEELGSPPTLLFKTPFHLYSKNDFYAPFASGSAQFDTMIIVPCSMGILGRIASGVSDDLITRAADVILKERRTLILVPRETPYNLIHIRNMETITLAGGIICPATPSFYHKPKTIDELADTVVDRVLDLSKITNFTQRWGNTSPGKH
jgi:flavin prenyltransferase